MADEVLCEARGRVLLITLNRPDARNAINSALGEGLVAAVERLDPMRSLVSVTGGEPLLQPEAVRRLAAALRATQRAILLETHGVAYRALGHVVSELDVVSMDWKLASSVRRESDPRSGEVAPFHDEHERFLEVALQAPSVYVKVVLTTETTDAELAEVCTRIGRVAPATPLILQPVTPFGPVRETPNAERLLGWLRHCRESLANVRLIPQTHKQSGLA